jgi:hypothetical protein
VLVGAKESTKEAGSADGGHNFRRLQRREMKANDYLQQLGLPNFFFFVTTAYNILRHRGIPLGKRDFLGPVNWL